MVSGLRPRLVVGERGRAIARAESMLHTRRFQAAG
jgi:hypothetical protein